MKFSEHIADTRNFFMKVKSISYIFVVTLFILLIVLLLIGISSIIITIILISILLINLYLLIKYKSEIENVDDFIISLVLRKNGKKKKKV